MALMATTSRPQIGVTGPDHGGRAAWLFSRKRPLRLDAERDALEFRLLEAAVKQHIPVLGICRGAQLVNIHFQGSLYQNIGDFTAKDPRCAAFCPGSGSINVSKTCSVLCIRKRPCLAFPARQQFLPSVYIRENPCNPWTIFPTTY